MNPSSRSKSALEEAINPLASIGNTNSTSESVRSRALIQASHSAAVYSEHSNSPVHRAVNIYALFIRNPPQCRKNRIRHPPTKKIVNNTLTIHTSHSLGLPKGPLWGQPVLYDFGEARLGRQHRGLIQAKLYRAPEVMFNMEWGANVDVWSVGALVWDLFENRHLFHALDKNGYSASHHIAEMVAYFGLPSLEYIRRSEVTRNVIDDEGRWKGGNCGTIEIPALSLSDSITSLSGPNIHLFMSFVKSMLGWLPEERKPASQLLQDPWLLKAETD